MVTFVTNFNKKNVNAKMAEISLIYIQVRLSESLKKLLVAKSVSQIRGAIKKDIVTVIQILTD